MDNEDQQEPEPAEKTSSEPTFNKNCQQLFNNEEDD